MTIQSDIKGDPFVAVQLPTAMKTINPLRTGTVAVVVPCYNEERRLDADAFIKFLSAQPSVRFIFVDDGSSDQTLTVLKTMQHRMPTRIDVLALPQNRGKAEAVRKGLMFATQTQACTVGYWDADLATPLSAIADFAEIVNRYDDVEVVFGSRMQLLGHRINRTLARRAVSRICSTLARMAVRLPVRDTQCGAKLFRNTPALVKSIDHEFTAGWLFDVELFTRLSGRVDDRSAAFFEFPLSEWTEVAGSKVSASVIVKSGFRMLRLIAETRFGSSSAKSAAPACADVQTQPRLAA